tara:strand:+ start:13641 stop:14642 length:1002 start_codon:yes stop_codon:yes gene_type:complete
MITVSSTIEQPEYWQKELAKAITDPAKLIKMLGLPDELIQPAQLATEIFPLKVTRHFLQLMKYADINDPLLRQILPINSENEVIKNYNTDPVGDNKSVISAGLLQKYNGRALIISTGACAVHCRYCFRKHFPYNEENGLRVWDSTLKKLRSQADIREIILSGGDPLSLSDSRFERVVEDLQKIPHLKRLRIHTRLPIVLPERITERLISTLAQSRFQTIIILHCNHPNELSTILKPYLSRLKKSGITLMNQAVLLRGVNDKIEVQNKLSERLFEFGVLPYYLHLLDSVTGASHFEVDEKFVKKLEVKMRETLPGYLIPKIVKEIAGEKYKIPQ